MNALRSVLSAIAFVLAGVAPLAQAPVSSGRLAHAGDPVRVPRVWTVDANGGGDFADLQLAIDAASSGDVIALRSNVAPPGLVRIEGKGLVLVGEGTPRRISNAGAACAGTLLVRDLPAGELVVLRDLRIETQALASPCGATLVSLEHNADEPALFGVQLVAPPLEIVVEGTIPGSGVLQSQTSVPMLRGVHTVFRQGLFFAAGGGTYLGSATVTVVIGS